MRFVQRLACYSLDVAAMDIEFASGPHDTMDFQEAVEDAAPAGCVAGFAERRETLRRANEAPIRARALLEQINRLE